MTGRATAIDETFVPRLVLVTNRPLIVLLFQGLAQRSTLSIDVMPRSAGAIEQLDEQLAGAAGALVDLGTDVDGSLDFCRELHRGHPLLPLAALVCCTWALTPSQLQTLLRLGVRSVFDLHGGPDEVIKTLETTVHGGSELHLTLEPAAADFLRELVTSREPRSATKAALLELVSVGLPEREMGRLLHLSPHTVKHHIEDLRRELHLRNRVELAAWAGRHGFYRPNEDTRSNVRGESLPPIRGAS